MTAAVSHAKSDSTRTIELVPIRAIDVKPQVRTEFPKESLQELAASIAANGSATQKLTS